MDKITVRLSQQEAQALIDACTMAVEDYKANGTYTQAQETLAAQGHLSDILWGIASDDEPAPRASPTFHQLLQAVADLVEEEDREREMLDNAWKSAIAACVTAVSETPAFDVTDPPLAHDVQLLRRSDVVSVLLALEER